MKKIYKYQLELGTNELEIPYEKILNVINQDRIPTLYALINTKQENKKIIVHVIGTGWTIDDNILENSSYLNTITDGVYVWHIFFQ